MPFSPKSIGLINDLFPEFREKDESFSKLFDLIVETNEKINITSITDEVPFLCKHLIDSLSFFKLKEAFSDFDKLNKICDMGCGGGFPGLPIAIADEKKKITMIDSTEKKIAFLSENANKLSLSNVIPLAGRGEDIGMDEKYREKFDIAVSRAVARLSLLSEICLPLVRKGGYFAAMKGGRADEELAECKNTFAKLGGKLLECKKINIELPDISHFDDEEKSIIEEYFASERYLIIVKKIKETDKKYPRRWSQIKNKPLV